ncbi:Peptidoglycan-binding domain 1 protein [Methylorubrum populi BJ001]|uniref:Peptidoglycan-binding domain 1 protein n=1 Tax=Methylorubrum populi (strain ATCC BAA-705 / NCIMB 13946 / BJ001) TaxID=441620 RepID=B1ZDV8_METPB|nr:peptidoglycan-binding protein [Methylorubrum populi]ACB82351.1 Peptidoglycan-binding domain 1 protein [Methylorubrum populi BJ001]
MTVAEIQRALLARGYDLGPSGADNALGRLTIAAVTAFQKAEKLDILYPGTIGPKTIAALGVSAAGPVAPPWIAEARRYLGLHERKDAGHLDKALRLDASEIPWCGAFVGMVIAATLPREVLPVNPLGARNWLKFGSEVAAPPGRHRRAGREAARGRRDQDHARARRRRPERQGAVRPMIALPWWASAAITFLARALNDWLGRKRAEQALRDLGAATQANAARAEAERQEAAAHRAGAAAEDGPDDPRDLRKD